MRVIGTMGLKGLGKSEVAGRPTSEHGSEHTKKGGFDRAKRPNGLKAMRRMHGKGRR